MRPPILKFDHDIEVDDMVCNDWFVYCRKSTGSGYLVDEKIFRAKDHFLGLMLILLHEKGMYMTTLQVGNYGLKLFSWNWIPTCLDPQIIVQCFSMLMMILFRFTPFIN